MVTVDRLRRRLRRRRSRQRRSIPELDAVPDLSTHRVVFIAGLHRSGTSILHRHLREHPDVSGFVRTQGLEDEGQYLQTVVPLASEFGGPGRFGFDPRAALTEVDAAALGERDRATLLRQWGAQWDLTRRVLLEKSPPTVIRTRFFQELFPDPRFVLIVRHPVVTALATQKWAGTTTAELLAHWCVVHARMLEDVPFLRHVRLIRYEDYVREPLATLAGVQQAVGLEPRAPEESTADHNGAYFDRWEAEVAEHGAIRPAWDGGSCPVEVIGRLGYSLEPPYVTPDWTPPFGA